MMRTPVLLILLSTLAAIVTILTYVGMPIVRLVELSRRAMKPHWRHLAGTAVLGLLALSIWQVIARAQPPCTAIGVGEGALAIEFVNAFERVGGDAVLGCGFGPIHRWGPGWIQDLRGGREGDAAIMSLGPAHETVVLAGAAWRDYEASWGPDSGPLMGYPTSKPRRCDQRQVFELAGGTDGQGAMVSDHERNSYQWIQSVEWQQRGGFKGVCGATTGFDGDP